jgi:hypothetical protein
MLVVANGASGHRRDAAQIAQSVVVSPAQGFPSLCEQRGEDDSSDSGQGSEDRRVMLLHWLPRLALLAAGAAAPSRPAAAASSLVIRLRLGMLSPASTKCSWKRRNVVGGGCVG